MLPDGRLLILNRRFGWLGGMSAGWRWRKRPRCAPARPSRRGEIAALAAPLTVDNMEALSVTRERGRTIVWLASDDNFMPLQRTLLLEFALEE